MKAPIAHSLLLLAVASWTTSGSEEAEDVLASSCDADDSVLLQSSAEKKAMGTMAVNFTQPVKAPEYIARDTDSNSSSRDAAEKVMGVKGNNYGDFTAFLSGVASSVATLSVISVIFSVLRQRYPIVYSGNVVKGLLPFRPADTYLSWTTVGFEVSTDEALDIVGLDSALMLEFINLAMKLMLIIGIPGLLGLSPLHCFFGGAEGVDILSWFGMNNVRRGHRWLYYVHGLMVVFVCVTVRNCVYNAQTQFLQRRFQWLKRMASPRCRTVMVEGIPEEFRSDEKLREFFSKAISADAVKDVFILKHTETLEGLVAAKASDEESKRQAELQFQKDGVRPTLRPGYATLEHVDSIDYFTKEVEKAEPLIAEERKRVLQEAKKTAGGMNCQNAFVTFNDRKHAEMAKELTFAPDMDEWVVSVPPELSTVNWANLRQSDEAQTANSFLGLLAVFGLYVSFMPVCIGTTNLATAINLGPLWASLAPTLGLTLFLSFLPTVLLLIVDTFFPLKSSQLAQEKLLVWYFWFQVIFVIFVTAIGNDFVQFCREVAENPVGLLSIMADQLPKATHFYMNYIALQWSAHFTQLLRYVNLSKFLTFKNLYPEEEAKMKSEPEAQDYYGFGSRSARWSINVLIGIIFGTLCPAIPLLVFVNFLICKMIYGYLILAAETRKPDLGGPFWVSNLRHILIGSVIYCMLMTGVLVDRAPNCIPAAMALVSLGFSAYSVWQFDHRFRWEALPFYEIMYKGHELKDADDTGEKYEQPELKA
mmetsp:Transcript_30131/g.54588  ORF Transcript_30131/g.54588 Transcript_30131/m.54588 type:complete len:761 (+) Transcript_30131:98-2380(+)|eukprot:CAMPEP_0197632022 /NCGR_PEP_ID=MMETSP1338-20131121/8971_1 /TAXON_ID=43686 ORGANISM="Pelagodinium beii, Strain RCC1491" /NCGR_SAMPLE_ID=MMETSP1338 /ASSEMBLY_ACC=CAM_ASM_000754 /LENGTH=760 /DNA_ID=CAMNT_0043203571 /DNA_START=96 /DNA_END=2378 /DNA_ORIENTATION=-